MHLIKYNMYFCDNGAILYTNIRAGDLPDVVSYSDIGYYKRRVDLDLPTRYYNHKNVAYYIRGYRDDNPPFLRINKQFLQ